MQLKIKGKVAPVLKHHPMNSYRVAEVKLHTL